MIGAMPVTLGRSLQEALADALHFSKSTSEETRQTAFHTIEQALSFHATRILRVAAIPQPAHIRATLEAVVAVVGPFAGMLDRARLPHAVVRALALSSIDDGTLRGLLLELEARSSIVLRELEGKPSRGMHNRTHGEALKKAKEAFAAIFDEYEPTKAVAGDDRAHWRTEFVALCCGRLLLLNSGRGAPKTRRGEDG